MAKSLNKIFKIIDNLDAEDNIKEAYKQLLLWEYDNYSVRYDKRVYGRLINSLEDF